ncbi:MAG: alanine racemase [Candidatus Accumulibacter sp.]|jgi:predicted amino acid racemase|nr:alanine racemase [Accumulibacter sp.]
MPAVLLNLDALRHNTKNTVAWAARLGVRVLPVLKGVASHPLALRVLRDEGFSRFALAETGELSAYGRTAEPTLARRQERVLMQICPVSQARWVSATFGRSFHSQLPSLRAVDRAAGELGIDHEAMLMVDVGEGREGVYLPDFPAFLEEALSLRHVRVAGVGVTLGCLGRRVPEDGFAEELESLRDLLRARGLSAPEISVGGSVFCAWLEAGRNRECVTEARLGANFILGEDTYRRADLPGGVLRRDVALLAAEVLEVEPRRYGTEAPALPDNDGYPLMPSPPPGVRRCALLDVGRMHVKLEDLACLLQGASIIGVSSNYTVLDVTDCAAAPKPGGRVFFRMGYWSMGRLFRSPAIEVLAVRDDSPERRAAMHAGTA